MVVMVTQLKHHFNYALKDIDGIICKGSNHIDVKKMV